MITDILFTVMITVLYIVTQLFKAINFLLPDQISTSLQFVLGYLVYLRGFIDLTTLSLVMQTFTTFLSGFYGYKIMLLIVGFFRKNSGHPKM